MPLYQLKAEFFKTLGHPARIRVLELLGEREHAVSELLPEVGVEPANLSQQLAVLRRAGLVVTRKEGSAVYYSLTSPRGRRTAAGGPGHPDRGAAGQVELLEDLRAARDGRSAESRPPSGTARRPAPEREQHRPEARPHRPDHPPCTDLDTEPPRRVDAQSVAQDPRDRAGGRAGTGGARPVTSPTAQAARAAGGSVQIRHVDAGSCNGCEVEIGAAFGPVYDAERYGARLVASPRHADALLVTGPVTRNMAEPLRRTYEAVSGPETGGGGRGLRPQLRGVRRRLRGRRARSATWCRWTWRSPAARRGRRRSSRRCGS